MTRQAASAMEPIEQRLAAAGLPPLPRTCWLEINESALADNVRVVRGLVGDATQINAVVKADAYGHGLVAVSRAFEAGGADRLCVATLDEALLVRGSGVEVPILVLFPTPPAEVGAAVEARLELVASEEDGAGATLRRWLEVGGRMAGRELVLHLEVETGLSRGGLLPELVGPLAQKIAATPGARLAGLWSHLATPTDEDVTGAQVRAFERASSALKAVGLAVPPRHISATGGLFSGWAPRFEGVRPGLALYGLLPDDLPVSSQSAAAAAGLCPAMVLKCRPLRVEELPAGTSVGYGGHWTSGRASRIATLPVGYADGWARSSSPAAEALVRGRRVPLVGAVAMDAVMADVTDVPGVGLADEFVLIGEQGGDRITPADVARGRNTIPWEVVATMAQRIPRVYHARTVLLGIRTLAGEVRVRS